MTPDVTIVVEWNNSALGWLYYTLYFVGELATLARLQAVRRVRV